MRFGRSWKSTAVSLYELIEDDSQMVGALRKQDAVSIAFAALPRNSRRVVAADRKSLPLQFEGDVQRFENRA